MTTSPRRAHTRTVKGKRVKVRRHQVNHMATAGALWDKTGLSRLGHRGLNHAMTGADMSKPGHTWQQRTAGALLSVAGAAEMLAWGTGHVGATAGLIGLALIFGGIGLARGGYTPQKPRSAKRDAAAHITRSRPVHRWPDEPAKPRKAKVSPLPADDGPAPLPPVPLDSWDEEPSFAEQAIADAEQAYRANRKTP